MATYTDSVTYDNLSLHAVVVPVDCTRMTLREQAQDASQVAYDVAAPQITNPTFRKYVGEPLSFAASPGTQMPAGSIPGYIRPVGSTVTFSRICES